MVYAAISDKASKDKIVINPEGRYTVSFDPLDNGGSNLDCNFAVGTIFGLWDSKEVIGSKSTGRSKLIGAAISGYGTRTTITIYNPLYKHIEEITLMSEGQWEQTSQNVSIKSKAKLFSFATKGIYDNPSLMTLYEQYICSGFSLRYSGCLAMDVNQIFVKNQGIYVMLHTIAHPSRLTLINLIPLAFLIEKAGGKASDGVCNLLDMQVNNMVQKVNFIAGSSEDVDYVVSELNEEEGNVSGKKGSYSKLLDLQLNNSM